MQREVMKSHQRWSILHNATPINYNWLRKITCICHIDGSWEKMEIRICQLPHVFISVSWSSTTADHKPPHSPPKTTFEEKVSLKIICCLLIKRQMREQGSCCIFHSSHLFTWLPRVLMVHQNPQHLPCPTDAHSHSPHHSSILNRQCNKGPSNKCKDFARGTQEQNQWEEKPRACNGSQGKASFPFPCYKVISEGLLENQTMKKEVFGVFHLKKKI